MSPFSITLGGLFSYGVSLSCFTNLTITKMEKVFLSEKDIVRMQAIQSALIFYQSMSKQASWCVVPLALFVQRDSGEDEIALMKTLCVIAIAGLYMAYRKTKQAAKFLKTNGLSAKDISNLPKDEK